MTKNKKLSKKEKEVLKALKKKKDILNAFIKNKFWSLHLDTFLLFSLSIAYWIVLIYTDNILGVIFIVFALICCSIISIDNYHSINEDLKKITKEFESLLS